MTSSPLSLSELYAQHSGLSSDKWNLYLKKYDQLFTNLRSQPINVLEVGVQNGGSLEIWAKYFYNASLIVGCDINPKCGALQFEDSRIRMVVGDINSNETCAEIENLSAQYNIVIDDGSHTSPDIIQTFLRIFPALSDDGIYIAEDLHCSYWDEFCGGINYEFSSMNFFKSLCDIVNFEHWGTNQTRCDHLSKFIGNFAEDKEKLLSKIHSVEFINSMCIITKKHSEYNVLGRRQVVGDVQVVAENKRLHGTLIGSRPQPSLSEDQESKLDKDSKSYIQCLKREISELKAELIRARDDATNLPRREP